MNCVETFMNIKMGSQTLTLGIPNLKEFSNCISWLKLLSVYVQPYLNLMDFGTRKDVVQTSGSFA